MIRSIVERLPLHPCNRAARASFTSMKEAQSRLGSSTASRTCPLPLMWSWIHTLISANAPDISPTSARTRVQRGADYLDSVDPHWYRSVDPVTLELSNGSHCVLGQMHGDYRMGLGRAHLLNMGSGPRASLSPVAYGFQAADTGDADMTAHDYDLLTAAWAEAVRTRHEADSTSPFDDHTPALASA